jgi:hypothetical protein
MSIESSQTPLGFFENSSHAIEQQALKLELAGVPDKYEKGVGRT